VRAFLVALFFVLLCALDYAEGQTWQFCANENGVCTAPPSSQIRYGANGSYVYQTGSGAIPCTNEQFGDPIVGTVKQCHYFVPQVVTNGDYSYRLIIYRGFTTFTYSDPSTGATVVEFYVQ